MSEGIGEGIVAFSIASIIKFYVSLIPVLFTLIYGLLNLSPIQITILKNVVASVLVFTIQYLLSMLTPLIYLFGLTIQAWFATSILSSQE